MKWTWGKDGQEKALGLHLRVHVSLQQAGGSCWARGPKCLLLHVFPPLLHGPSDLFHWACLNERAAQLPRNTAPAGYQCPSCSGPIFPPTNLAGPVASALREKLATVNWARAGLGLPLVRACIPWVPPGPGGWVGTALGRLVTSVLSSGLTRW